MKIGLEIHQQLATKKLFCGCPSALRDDPPPGKVVRKLRAVSGELGVVDEAAMHETGRERTFVYEFYPDTTCLVELDDEPPHELNPEALGVALQLAKLLHMRVVDRIQIMRKIVIDGSNPSGFQRTALVARNGILKTPDASIRIATLCIEEESGRIIEQRQDSVSYRLDRLGIPLIEIATEPDITSPEQCKSVAHQLGMLLRSTGRVRRGIGTIRQDVNISIEGGNRIEIKGAQDLRLLPTLVDYEVQRQQNMIPLRKCLADVSFGPAEEVTSSMMHTGSKMVQKVLQANGSVFGMRCGKAKGIFGQLIQPGRRLGTEFSDVAKVKTGIGGLMHADELPGYGITLEEVDAVRASLGCHDDAGFIIVLGESWRALRALQAVRDHCALLKKGTPQEVRKANPDGTSSYLRPIPGAARMYPETDTKPVVPHPELVTLPLTYEQRFAHYEKLGLSHEMTKLVLADDLPLEELQAAYRNIPLNALADFFLNSGKEIKRRFNIEVDPLGQGQQLVALWDQGAITRDAVFELLVQIGQGKHPDPMGYRTLSPEELEVGLKEIINQHAGMAFNALVGKAMETLRGRAEGKDIVETLRRLLRTA
ncbi:MAG: Glu-tRNA(Gln) amidotransferase subunit GatE [Nanoarchaeota archaeon]